MLAAALAAGCGAQERPDRLSSDLEANLERIQHESDGPVYWVGPTFEGLPFTHSEGPRAAPAPLPHRKGAPDPPIPPAPGPFFVYGECRGEGDGDSYHCTGPQIQLQHWPIASPSRYPDYFSCTRTTIRGVPAAQFGAFEIYIGRLIVRISAPNQAQARRAAAALRPLDGSASPSEPLPAPTIDVSDALRRCALDSLEAKLDELREHGQIPFLWAGRRFEELPLFRAEGDGRVAWFFYGGCKTPEISGSCYPPLTVEVSPVADRRPASWRAVRKGMMRCERLHIRGAEAAFLPYAHELVVFTGPVAVLLRGPDLRLLRRAADGLHPFDGATTPEQRSPPSDDLNEELQRVCPSPGG
jgi:hypothetical protein